MSGSLLTRAFLARPVLAPLLGVLAGTAALVAAFVAQYGFGLEPCVLCIWQRWALAIAVALALPGLVPGGTKRLAAAASGLAFLAGAGIAAFHVGVENKWWQGTAGCHAPAFGEVMTAEQLRQSLMGTEVVACDEVAWSLFGLSMADYNFLYSAAVGLILLGAAVALGRRAG